MIENEKMIGNLHMSKWVEVDEAVGKVERIAGKEQIFGLAGESLMQLWRSSARWTSSSTMQQCRWVTLWQFLKTDSQVNWIPRLSCCCKFFNSLILFGSISRFLLSLHYADLSGWAFIEPKRNPSHCNSCTSLRFDSCLLEHTLQCKKSRFMSFNKFLVAISLG